jgi:hypothetical protein
MLAARLRVARAPHVRSIKTWTKMADKAIKFGPYEVTEQVRQRFFLGWFQIGLQGWSGGAVAITVMLTTAGWLTCEAVLTGHGS